MLNFASNIFFQQKISHIRIYKQLITGLKVLPRLNNYFFLSFNLYSSSSASNNFALSTDLQCYFGCDESFKKDYQLHLHLKLKHRNEDPEELAKAYEAAEEEIALTRRSASIFNCALCPKTFNDNGAFYGHIQV